MKTTNKKKLKQILKDDWHPPIKSFKFDGNKMLVDNYIDLIDHHTEETELLISIIKELAQELLDKK